MSSSTVIISIDDLIADLMEGIDALLSAESIPGFKGFSKAQASMYIGRRFDDLLGERLLWGNVLNESFNLWVNFIPWITDINPQSELFIKSYQLKEQLDILILNDLKRIIPEKSWSIWFVKPLCDSVIIEEGGDFRIADWERRMANGEWKIPDSDTETVVHDVGILHLSAA